MGKHLELLVIDENALRYHFEGRSATPRQPRRMVKIIIRGRCNITDEQVKKASERAGIYKATRTDRLIDLWTDLPRTREEACAEADNFRSELAEILDAREQHVADSRAQKSQARSDKYVNQPQRR